MSYLVVKNPEGKYDDVFRGQNGTSYVIWFMWLKLIGGNFYLENFEINI